MLDDYLEDIPSTIASTSRADVIPDSADEESDIDEPKAIAPPSTSGPSRFGLSTQSRSTPSAGPSRGLYGNRPAGPLHPKAMAGNVQAVVGRGGKLQYEVQSSFEDARYYAVQW